MRVDKFQRRLYRLTYDKPSVHHKALQLWRSIEEVKKLLNGPVHGKSGRSRCEPEKCGHTK